MSPDTWLVYTPESGLLRKENTRTALVDWLCTYVGGKVIARYTYAPGSYDYRVGCDEDDAESFTVVRETKARASGFNPYQLPLFPHRDDPFEEVPRD